ncbi:HpcH/HpaI aldolase family protein [Sinomonas sp. RB5]
MSAGRHSRLRRILGEGGTAVGLSCALGSAQIAEEFALAGFDFVYIDQQHGLTPQHTLLEMLRAIARSDTTPLVRVARNDSALIGQALDAGAEGVIVPMVNTAAEASRAARACRYQPLGQRSWGPIRAAHGLGTDPEHVNREVLCFVMIETAEGLSNVDQIVDTPGVDGVYLGPADLAVSLGGAPLSFDQAVDPRHLEAIAAIRQACTSSGRIAGISGDPERLAAEGFRMITAGMDLSLIRTSLAGILRPQPIASTR